MKVHSYWGLGLALALVTGCTKEPAPTGPVPENSIHTISLAADPENLDQTNPNSHSTITALCLDLNGRPVSAGQRVMFRTTIGTITPEANTDAAGRAVAYLLPGSRAGIAQITAEADGPNGVVKGGAHVAMVNPAIPISIHITAAPTMIAAHGAGGIETSVLTVTILNGIGAPVTQEVTVFCRMLNEPQLPAGCIVNGVGQLDSVVTENAVALFGINAGTQIGGKSIGVNSWRDVERQVPVSAVFSNIAVVGGPPQMLSVDLNKWGWDAGGGLWEVEVSASVWDANYNPVADGLPVGFTVDQGDHATVSTGYTGNRSRYDTTLPGVAYGRLLYHSVNTFEPVTITANVQGEDGPIWSDRAATLPLQQGYLSLHADPANWMFDRARPQDSCRIRVWAVLKDGHDVEINNAPVLFTADRGQFYWLNLAFAPPRMTMFYPDPVRKLTGVVDQQNNEQPGQATVYLRGDINAFYLDDFTLEVAVHLGALVEGTDVLSDPVTVSIKRH